MSELRQECLWEFVTKPTVAAQALAVMPSSSAQAAMAASSVALMRITKRTSRVGRLLLSGVPEVTVPAGGWSSRSGSVVDIRLVLWVAAAGSGRL